MTTDGLPLFDLPRTRRTDPGTSGVADRRNRTLRRTSQYGTILLTLVGWSTALSADRLDELIGWRETTVGRRLGELVELGYVSVLAEVADTRSGNPAHVYGLTPKGQSWRAQ